MTTLLTRGAEGLDRRGFSLAEIEAMLAAGILDPDEKFELIDGEIVPMSPQNAAHMRIKARIVKRWTAHLSDQVLLVPEATLTLGDQPARTFETDILILRGADVPSPIRPADVALAIEVADTSRDRDLLVKAPRYGQAGVIELWVVDIQNRVTVVHRAPGAAGYADVRAAAFDETLTPLFDPALTLTIADIDR